MSELRSDGHFGVWWRIRGIDAGPEDQNPLQEAFPLTVLGISVRVQNLSFFGYIFRGFVRGFVFGGRGGFRKCSGFKIE